MPQRAQPAPSDPSAQAPQAPQAIAAASAGRSTEPAERSEKGSRPDGVNQDYDEVLDRVFEQVTATQAAVAQEQSQGIALHSELRQHPPGRQRILLKNSARFRNRSLCERLVADSHEAGFQEPPEAVELAELAVQVASQLSADSCGGAEMLYGLQARAWAQLGNAQRINADFAGAERAFAAAERLLGSDCGVGLLDKARVLDLRASLLRDQRQFQRAASLLDRVISIYTKLGQMSLLGRALNQKATVCGEAGDQEAELELLRRAAEHLDPEDDPRMYLTVRHNLINALNDSGRSREAFSKLFHARPLYLKLGDRMNLLRLRWLEGQVALGLDRIGQAELAFREVRDAFLELRLDYDAALASLELAEVYLRQGRTAAVKQLAEETLAVFKARDIHREAMAALFIFCRAAEAERAETALVHEVTNFLKKSRHNPNLRFTPAGA